MRNKRQRPAPKSRRDIRGATLLAALVLSSAAPSASAAGDSNSRRRSRYESIDELGEHYFDVSDWTSSAGDDDEIETKARSQITLNDLAKQADNFGIQPGEWTWPYPLTEHDAKLLSDDERKYVEQEFGVAMPRRSKDEKLQQEENTEGLVSKIDDDDDNFVAPETLGLATQRQRRRRLMSVEEPMAAANVHPRTLRGNDGIDNRTDPRRRRRKSQQLNLVSNDNNTGESGDEESTRSAPSQGINTYRCIDDSPNNAVPCPPDNMGPICDKYNPEGSFRQCYEMCKPSFCCIHDSQSQTLSPSCAQSEPNCESYFACYIIWWRLHNTVGPATFLRVPQSDEAFYDITYEEVIGDLAADEVFRNQLFNHHFDTDTVPTDADFEDPNNW